MDLGDIPVLWLAHGVAYLVEESARRAAMGGSLLRHSLGRPFSLPGLDLFSLLGPVLGRRSHFSFVCAAFAEAVEHK